MRYRVEWQTPHGDLYPRMMSFIDLANGMFVIDELHVLPDRWMAVIACEKSAEHVRSLFIQTLREDFPLIDKYINVTELGDD